VNEVARPEHEGGDELDLLAQRLVTAEQDERRRLALFLHDGPVQTLSGIALMLDAVGHEIDVGNLDAARRVLDDALKLHRSAIRSLRDLSFNLEPVVLRDQGFTPAVIELAHQVREESELEIELDVEVAEQLAERTQAALYQIVREALNGAVRRGPPTSISVRIERGHDDRFITTIVDDGAQERRREFFDVLAERARTLNGRLTFDQGAGTKIVLELPPSAARD
jgi:signal transduction histidine kinase